MTKPSIDSDHNDVGGNAQPENPSLSNQSKENPAVSTKNSNSVTNLVTANGQTNHADQPSPALVNGKSRPQPKPEPSFDDSDNPDASSSSTIINEDEEDQMIGFGYRKYAPYVFGTWIFYVITFGMLRLVFHWKPQWRLYFTHIRCDFACADRIMLIDKYKQIFVENIVKIQQATDRNGNIKHSSNYSTFANSKRGSEDEQQEHRNLLQPDGKGNFNEVQQLISFVNKQQKYIWNEETQMFDKLQGLDQCILCSKLHSAEPLSDGSAADRRYLFGLNEIGVNVQSYGEILFGEIVEPFYVFQIFSVVMWCADNYVYYATCIVIMSALSLAASVIQIRRNQQQLRDTVHAFDTVTVCRPNDQTEQIESSQLVPGDVIVLPAHGGQLHCDAVLISGNAIVNESMLTGESVPVTKTPIPVEIGMYYDLKEHAKHTLYCGTHVIQTRFYSGGRVKAVVVRTGYLSAKGELVRSILFPKPVDFQFNRHIYRFIHCLAVIATAGFIYTVVLKVQRHVPFRDIFFKAFDLITIIIPPALPAAMTVGVVYAQSRLRKEQIFCISPRSINISGCLNCVCFDKTGTLTEDELNFAELRPVDNQKFSSSIRDPKQMSLDHPVLGCLSTCHGLTQIDGRLVGDPLDQKMFECTGWELNEPQVNDTNKFDLLAPTLVSPPAYMTSSNETPIEIGILRQFPFSSSLQRQSVITKKLEDSHHVLYAKGAPEMIASLCDQSTLPIDFDQVLARYTAKGMRVLALADRHLQLNYVRVQKLSREEAEKDMRFLGLLVMGNMLKPQSRPVLRQLRAANIRCVMVTGDNMLTALSVSRECSMISKQAPVALLQVTPDGFDWEIEKPDQQLNEMEEVEELNKSQESENDSPNPPLFADSIDQPLSHTQGDFLTNSLEQATGQRDSEDLHVAITGNSFAALREFYPEEVMLQVVARGSVFARMSPEQKQQLIELLQSLGYYVGMCGDGANDCGALKAAHAGVSLSETEASVASPFTSKQPHIGCIPALVREGRASLVTAFGILKYMASYSLTQFMSVLLLYTFHTNLTDMQFLYVDLFLISFFFVLFGRTHAYRRLARRPPPSSLIGLVPLLSMFFQLILIIAFQCAGVWLVQRQPWYVPHTSDSESLTCDDNYAVFAISVFQYISLAVIFSKGVPYRRPIYTNVLFLMSLIVMSAVTVYVVVYPHPFLQSLFEMDMEHIPIEFRTTLVLLAFCNLLLSLFAESFVIDYLVFKKLKNSKFYRKYDTQTPAYEKLRADTADLQWLRDAATIGLNRQLAKNQSPTNSEESSNTSNSRSVGSPAGESALSGNSSTALLICESSKEILTNSN